MTFSIWLPTGAPVAVLSCRPSGLRRSRISKAYGPELICVNQPVIRLVIQSLNASP